ncbi:MAG: hypothetical protein LBF22_05805 [Deltaproteobacteria bacterium]|nr:hypothetical protein [Deltaproteobacteria bacterium]
MHGFFKKTCIVVPASVIGAWDNECRRFFTPEFLKNEIFLVGLVTDGKKKGTFQPTKAREDMEIALKGKHSLVIMTKEKFNALKLKKKNRKHFAKYAFPYCPHLRSVLYDYVEEESENGKGEDSNWPYFEDFGFDNLIIDEAHVYKNSLTCSGVLRVIAYLSTPTISKSGLDAIAKTYYIRSKNGGRGTYGLSATPVTNSPFEIYNALALITDLNIFHIMGVYNIDDIIKVFGKVQVIAATRIGGATEQMEALLGFVNLDGLRTLFNRFVHFDREEYSELNFSCPDKTEFYEYVTLTQEQDSLYNFLRDKAIALGETLTDKRGELITHILAIIRQMDRLTLDIDTYNREITFIFEKSDEKRVQSIVDKFPKRFKLSVISSLTGKREKIEQEITYTFFRTPEGQLALKIPEEMDDAIVSILKDEHIPEEHIVHPTNPKYERLVELVKVYHDQEGKQLIFTEEKTHHRILKRVLSKHLNIPLKKIGIINSEESAGYKLEKTINDYNNGNIRIVIANRKAELGVNLQIGTTAIHHITLPWTPASIQQRNGRGIRQGNIEDEVRVHYYFGKNTFDKYRHTIIQAKSNWIMELLSGECSTLTNNDAIDIEELLDLLAKSPEEAEARRSKRKQQANELYHQKQQEGLIHILKTITILHAKHKKDIDLKETKLKADKVKIQSKLQKLKELEEELNQQGSGANNKFSILEKNIEDIKKILCSPDTPFHERSDYMLKLKDLLKKHEKLINKHEFYWNENINSRISNLKNEIKDREQRQIKQTEDLISYQESYDKCIQQNINYLKEMDEKGKLPFDINVLDKLGSILVTPKNKIVATGEHFKKIGKKITKFFQISTVFPDTKNLEVVDTKMDKKSTITVDETEVDLWEKIPIISDSPSNQMPEAPLVYGHLQSNKLYDKEKFMKEKKNLTFDLTRGLICRKNGSLVVLWDQNCPFSEDLEPIWPEPYNPEFCIEICKAWLQAHVNGVEPPSQLMQDLFGDNFRVLAYSYSETPSLNFLNLRE